MAYGKAEEIIVVRKWKVEKYMEQIYVQTEDLSVGYHKKVLLSDIALKVNKGEILVLIGPNGAGKFYNNKESYKGNESYRWQYIYKRQGNKRLHK